MEGMEHLPPRTKDLELLPPTHAIVMDRILVSFGDRRNLCNKWDAEKALKSRKQHTWVPVRHLLKRKEKIIMLAELQSPPAMWGGIPYFCQIAVERMMHELKQY